MSTKVTDAIWGYVDDELGFRQCVWFPVGQVDLEVAKKYLGAEDVEQADYTWEVHRRVKWCEKYSGWPCDQEGEFHTHWEQMNGPATHTGVWSVDDA